MQFDQCHGSPLPPQGSSCSLLATNKPCCLPQVDTRFWLVEQQEGSCRAQHRDRPDREQAGPAGGTVQGMEGQPGGVGVPGAAHTSRLNRAGGGQQSTPGGGGSADGGAACKVSVLQRVPLSRQLPSAVGLHTQCNSIPKQQHPTKHCKGHSSAQHTCCPTVHACGFHKRRLPLTPQACPML